MRARHFLPIVSAILILVAVELGLERRAAQRGFSTLFFGKESEMLPKNDQRSKEKRAYGPTSDFPFRSSMIDHQKTPGTIRIWIASASHAFDARIKAENIFPNRLKDELDKRGVRSEVLNASGNGIRLKENAVDLETLALSWKPDVVVIYQMSTEFVGMARSTGRSESLPTGGGNAFFHPVRKLAERTTTYELLKSNLTSRINASAILAPSIPEATFSNYSQELDQVIRNATKIGARTFVCTFCFSHPENDLPRDYELVLLKNVPKVAPQAWSSTISRWNNDLRKTAGKYEIIDLDSSISGKPALFRDPVHFSDDGHKRIAEEIATALAKKIGQPGVSESGERTP